MFQNIRNIGRLTRAVILGFKQDPPKTDCKDIGTGMVVPAIIGSMLMVDDGVRCGDKRYPLG